MIIDNFLESFGALKELSINGEFKDEPNAIDGVVYPEICKDIPEEIRVEVEEKLSKLLGSEVDCSAMFLRRSPEGVNCPNIVHHDLSMGRYSLMLYMNEHEGMGTSMVAHRSTGIAYAPELREFVAIIAADSNDLDAWIEVDFTEAKENRALIFDAAKMHRAEPVGGFGQGKDSRVVLTCFFSAKND